MASDLASSFSAVGGASILTALIGWFTGRKIAAANARRLDAEADKLEAEASKDTIAVRVDFERVLNDRTKLIMDALQEQVSYLTKLVETQNAQLLAQTAQMHQMEIEIRDLRRALIDKVSPI